MSFWDTNGSLNLGQKTRPEANKKKNLSPNGFRRPDEPQKEYKRKRKEKEKILGPWQRTKSSVQHEGDDDTNSSWNTGNSSQMLEKGNATTLNQYKNRPEYWEESWIFGKYAVTHVPVHQLMLEWKVHKK